MAHDRRQTFPPGISHDRIAIPLKIRDVVSLLKETVRALSGSNRDYLAFVLGPEYETTTFEAIYLLPASVGRALLVIVSDVGVVENCLIDVPSMSREEMEYVSNILREHLYNLSLDQVHSKAQALLRKRDVTLQ